jgi:hypothetical protein
MTVPLLKKLRARFVDRPLPDAVFELTPGRLCGIRVSARGRPARKRFILPLEMGAISPSFDRPNVIGVASVKLGIEEGKKVLGLGGGTISLIIPEPCVRIFILTADSIPSAPGDRDAFVRWRVGKQMPLLPEDLRLDYDFSVGPGPRKIIVAAVREAIIGEYEDLFQSAGMKVGTVTIPSLSLVNLLDGGPGANAILLNIETDNLSFLAVMDSGWTLYRQKGVGTDLLADEKAALVVKEIENTVHFLEDKERMKVEKVWVRSESWEEGPLVVARLGESLTLPAEMIEYAAPEDWDPREKAILAPLVGQIS